MPLIPLLAQFSECQRDQPPRGTFLSEVSGPPKPSPQNERKWISGPWDRAPVTVTENHFKHKALSAWALNFTVGCHHGCSFCYVPEVSAVRLSAHLARHGVNDPDADWGNYAFLRDWDESAFLRSLSKAEETPFGELPPDGNRAVMLSTTSDAYQIIRHSDANRQKELNLTFRGQVRRALELIRDHSSLNVRILTRSPLAKQDFDLFQSLGDRLLLGVSLPTLRHDLTNIYEPCSPAPIHRLNLLKAARAVGISTCVAIAPTFPECDEGDLRRTLSAVAELGCMTLYHEPINIRAENVARIEAHAARIGKTVKTGVFASRESWKDYALGALHLVERLAAESGISDAQLKLWPDSSLGSQWVMKAMGNDEREAHSIWLHRHWSRPSQWPSHQGTAKHRSEAVAEYH